MKSRYYLSLLAVGCGIAIGMPNSSSDSHQKTNLEKTLVSQAEDTVAGLVSDVQRWYYVSELEDYKSAKASIEKGHYGIGIPLFESFVEANKGVYDIKPEGREVLDKIISNAVADIGFYSLVENHVSVARTVADLSGIVDHSYANPLIEGMIERIGLKNGPMHTGKNRQYGLVQEDVNSMINAAIHLGISDLSGFALEDSTIDGEPYMQNALNMVLKYVNSQELTQSYLKRVNYTAQIFGGVEEFRPSFAEFFDEVHNKAFAEQSLKLAHFGAHAADAIGINSSVSRFNDLASIIYNTNTPLLAVNLTQNNPEPSSH